jgi:hypothetical protein
LKLVKIVPVNPKIHPASLAGRVLTNKQTSLLTHYSKTRVYDSKLHVSTCTMNTMNTSIVST